MGEGLSEAAGGVEGVSRIFYLTKVILYYYA